MNQQKEMSKRQMRREQIRRKEARGRWLGIGLVTLGAVLVVALFLIPVLKPIGEVLVPPTEVRPNAQANSTGNPDAPIKIDEYGDFQCPHCQNFYLNTEPQLVETYVKDGTVYFTYHSVGEFIGAESARAAEAAYCAGDQNRFWDMHDTIFTNQTGENVGAFSDRRLTAFADKLGLDMSAFKSCFNDGKYKDKVTQDSKDANAAGVKATPSFVVSYVVNGETKTKLIEGAQGFDSFKQEIEADLKEMGK